MVAPPTHTAAAQSAWNTTTTPKSATSINVTNGDVLVVCALSADVRTWSTPTNTNTAQTWTLQQSLSTTGDGAMSMWTAVVSGVTAASAMVVSIASGTGAAVWGFVVMQLTGSDGVGATTKSATHTTTPTLAITTTVNNSAVCSFHTDCFAVDGTTRTWRTINGSAESEDAYFRLSTDYTVYAGYRVDAGTAGSVTTGLSAPTTASQYSNMAVEVKGAAGAVAAGQVIRRNPGRGLILRGRR